MVQKDDWRLLNDVENLNNKYLNKTNGEELIKHAPYLKRCVFCWENVKDNPYQMWFIPADLACCICKECYDDFKEMFKWKELDGWDIIWD